MHAGLLSHSLFAAAPLMMNQGDAEMGMPVVNMQPAPVAIENDDITSSDLVSRTA